MHKKKINKQNLSITKVGLTLFAATIFTLSGIIVLIVILYLAYTNKSIFDWSQILSLEKGAKVGDLVGGFAGVFFTAAGILLLYRTLQLQRSEFEKTHQIIASQQFETTFFNMLNVLMNIVNNSKASVTFEDTLFNPEEGYQLFYKTNTILHDYLTKELVKNDHSNILNCINNLQELKEIEKHNLISTLDKGYSNFYEKNGLVVGHYNRYFFSVVKFIINHKEDKDEIQKYLDIVQAQLSNQEMGLLFYYSISSVGTGMKKEKQLYNWLDDYSFFRNITKESLEDTNHHIIYPKTIFKFQSIDSVKWKTSLQ